MLLGLTNLIHHFVLSPSLVFASCRVGRGRLLPSSVRSINRYIRFSRIPLSDMESYRFSFILNCTFSLPSFLILRIQIQGLLHKEYSFFCNLLTNSIANFQFYKASCLPINHPFEMINATYIKIDSLDVFSCSSIKVLSGFPTSLKRFPYTFRGYLKECNITGCCVFLNRMIPAILSF